MVTPAPGARAGARRGAARTGRGCGRGCGEPAFLGLALCFAAHAFINTGLAAHLIPLLRERGWPEATVLLSRRRPGPCQVAARALMFAAGRRVTMRAVGRFATALLPVGHAALALGATA